MDDTYELNLKDIGSWVASSALIFGAVIPYIPQYKEIKRKEDAEGFSLYVCLTLLIANTLRILFWFVFARDAYFIKPVFLCLHTISSVFLSFFVSRSSDKNKAYIYIANKILFTYTAHVFISRFGKRYELPLLLQSLLMIVAMFVMIKLCINVQNRTQIIKSKERVLMGEQNCIIKEIGHNYNIIIYMCLQVIFLFYRF